MQPQAHKMPAALQLGMIFEGSAVVENPPIVDEVHVSGLQVEFGAQLGAAENLVEDVECGQLGGRQWLACFFMTCLDPVAKVTDAQCIAIGVQDRELHRRRVSLANAAAAIDVERPAQRGECLGMMSAQLGKHGKTADDLAAAAGLGRLQAQESNVIKDVGAE